MLRPLLIPLTYFCLHTWLGIPQTKCEVKLSMMDDAFDDQYLGCAKEMDGIAPGLLEKEKSKSSLLRTSTNRTCSRFNCAYLGGEKNEKCVDNSATRRGLAFPSVLSPSLFGGPILLVHVTALKLFADF
ncbi:ecto-ADP-ribosyltransferase 5-like isoform X3 [Eretmochelys imbricata]